MRKDGAATAAITSVIGQTGRTLIFTAPTKIPMLTGAIRFMRTDAMSGKKSDDGREWTGTDLVDRHKVVLALDRIKMRGDETWYDYYHKALDAIAKLTPVNAVPVRRGKWIHYLDEFDGETAECSVCHIEGMLYGNYCPNCGARMENSDG